MKKALVIDGNSLIYRCFFATYNMIEYYKKNNITPTNALYLFTTTTLKLLDQGYDYAFVAFDHHKKTFRNELFEQYKANRPSMPEELAIQLPLVKKMLSDIGVVHMSKEGFEADDLIGSYCRLMSDNNIQVDIYTSDKDMLQLVNNNISTNLLKTGISNVVRYDINNFSSLYFGLTPNQIVDFKAIVGDGSDNFAGIKGIGPKTAIELLKKFGSFNNIYCNIESLPKKQQEKFIEYKKNGEVCYQIATIQTHLFVDKKIEEFIKMPINKERFESMVKQCNFKKLDKYFTK